MLAARRDNNSVTALASCLQHRFANFGCRQTGDTGSRLAYILARAPAVRELRHGSTLDGFHDRSLARSLSRVRTVRELKSRRVESMRIYATASPSSQARRSLASNNRAFERKLRAKLRERADVSTPRRYSASRPAFRSHHLTCAEVSFNYAGWYPSEMQGVCKIARGFSEIGRCLPLNCFLVRDT